MSSPIPPGPRESVGVGGRAQHVAASSADAALALRGGGGGGGDGHTKVALAPSTSTGRADPATLAKLCGASGVGGVGGGPHSVTVCYSYGLRQLLSSQASHSASNLAPYHASNAAATTAASTSTLSSSASLDRAYDNHVFLSASDALGSSTSDLQSHSTDTLSVAQSQQRAQHLATRRGTHAGTTTSSGFMGIPAFQNNSRRASAYSLRDPRVAPIASDSTSHLTPTDRLAALSGLIRSFATLPTDDPDTPPSADPLSTTTGAPPPRIATPLTSISVPHTSTPLTLTSATDSSHMYTTHRTLVEGSAGKIKLATHVLTGEQVVIKCLDKATLQIDHAAWHAACAKSPHAKERTAKFEKKLREEANAEGSDQGSPPKRVLEPFRRLGGQLPAELRSGMSEARARHLVAQVVHAVEHCHSRGIVHRDLKPENILINSMGHVQLIDFGFTNVLDDPSHLMTTFCGSISYAAPEMLAKQPYAGMPCDVWSLGVTIFVMVTGYLPFDESSLVHMYQHMMARKVEYPSSMSDELKDLLHHMLDPDPSTRYTIHQVQANDWFDVERREAPYLFVPSTPPAPSDSDSPPSTFRPVRMPVHLPTLRHMLHKFSTEFPDAQRTADLVAAGPPRPNSQPTCCFSDARRHDTRSTRIFLTHTYTIRTLRRQQLERGGSAGNSDDAIASAPLSPVVAGKLGHHASGGLGSASGAHLSNQRWNSFTRHSLAALEVQLELVAEEVGAEAATDAAAKDGSSQGRAQELGEEDPGVRELGEGGSGSMPPAVGLAGFGARPARVGMTIVEEEEEEQE
ncbi:kinase-like domain-containing protein [Catenaria anguillulae PL171]|uniref:Kinase-like domain-containing protein n=1 Tax=Catenaria anguillulae PL171 TaxID=765915 RepID=A0A1Y2HIR9_9FUNG|nr:kinase-like domain-containing protein [Catenaria anguillulae PL171]